MARTPSNMLPLGTTAPEFSLIDTISGEVRSLGQLKSDNATVVMFICNHCPFVIHILENLVDCAASYKEKGVSFIAISSNDVQNYPDDSPDKMKALAKQYSFSFPYLYDESQDIAKAYDAACTPDFYIFDQDLSCIYRGQYDDSSPGTRGEVTGKDLREALDNILSGKQISNQQKPSIGCNIKWKS